MAPTARRPISSGPMACRRHTTTKRKGNRTANRQTEEKRRATELVKPTQRKTAHESSRTRGQRRAGTSPRRSAPTADRLITAAATGVAAVAGARAAERGLKGEMDGLSDANGDSDLTNERPTDNAAADGRDSEPNRTDRPIIMAALQSAHSLVLGPAVGGRLSRLWHL